MPLGHAQEEPQAQTAPTAEQTGAAPAEPAQVEPAPANAEPQQEATTAGTIPVAETKSNKAAATAKETYPDDAVHLDTIEVTASKRVKQQRDIPGSVGAIKGETLEKMSAQNMKDYLKLVPGVTLVGYEGQIDHSIPIIRGIATETSFSNGTVPVGIYVDDLPFTDLAKTVSVPDLNPFDLERVEVLKGPQGTLFGSGALAGAVRFVLHKPQPGIWEAKFQQTFAKSSIGSLSPTSAGAINIPLGDDAAIRAVGVYRRSNGTTDDLSRHEKDVDKVRQNTWRVLAAWNPAERLNLSAFYFTQKSLLIDNGYATFPDRFEREQVTPFPNHSTSALSGTNFQAAWNFDWGRLLSSSNYVTKRAFAFGQGISLGTGVTPPPSSLPPPASPDPNCQSGCDIGTEDQSATPFGLSYNTGLVHGYFQELRLSSPEGGAGPWEWLVGAAYQNYNQHIFFSTTATVAVPQSPVLVETPVGPAPSTRILNVADSDIFFYPKEKSVFGEFTRQLGERWEVTAGARAFQTKANSDFIRRDALSIINTQVGELPNTEPRTHRENDQEQGINPKFSLRYKHNRNAQVYLLAAKGYQFGGPQFQPNAIGEDQLVAQRGGFSPTFYKSSKLWNYEIGLRTEWLDRRLRFDTTFFYLDWKDLQVSQTVYITGDETRTSPSPQVNTAGRTGAFFIIGNVGSAHSAGAELSFEVKPFEDMTFTSAATWISALLDEPYKESDAKTFPPGTPLPGAQHFQMANVLAYQHRIPFTQSMMGGVALTHVHLGTAYTTFRKDNDVGGYDTLDARLSLGSRDPQWFLPDINLGISNLTDVRGISFQDTKLNGFPNRTPFYYFIQPRTTVLSLAFRF